MSSWSHFNAAFLRYPDLGITLDYSRIAFPDGFFASMESLCARAYRDMERLECGEIVNISENRQVGHYWLRDDKLAPDPEIGAYIRNSLDQVRSFAAKVHSGELRPSDEETFTHLLLIGIGGSALGPQLVADALFDAGTAKLEIAYFDNTDPDGIDRVLGSIPLHRTVVLVISKSGSTKETSNGMYEAEAAFAGKGLKFARHAVAVSGDGSELDVLAQSQQWIGRFHMKDWVGGRTSVTSVVGLLPMALLGLDIEAFLAGAACMDAHTRLRDTDKNASMILALVWHFEGQGKGLKDMVIIPYKDRLGLLAKYLQQLVMESLGKEEDLDGNTVHQGLAVYGNKGSTDQHAYIQQLRDGIPNFFATFIEVLQGRAGASIAVAEDGITSGDYLQGFLRGTREALTENERSSLTIGLEVIDARRLGALIALYERAVGFYASLVHVNAYDQPGVEAGKKAAKSFIILLSHCRRLLAQRPGEAFTAESLAKQVPVDDDYLPTIHPEAVFHALTHLAANDSQITVNLAATPQGDLFTLLTN